jgi:hypothetical protein
VVERGWWSAELIPQLLNVQHATVRLTVKEILIKAGQRMPPFLPQGLRTAFLANYPLNEGSYRPHQDQQTAGISGLTVLCG